MKCAYCKVPMIPVGEDELKRYWECEICGDLDNESKKEVSNES